VAAHLPGGNPIGQTIRFRGPENSLATIVGIAGNTQLSNLKETPEPIVFGAYTQHLQRITRMTFLVRGADTLALATSARHVVGAMDSRIPVMRLAALDSLIQGTIRQERLFAFLCSAFAALALVIASVGLYGTLAYGVTRRTGEIGVRMALGARRGRVVAMILRESSWMVAAGLAVGLPLVWASETIIGSFLFPAPGEWRAVAVAVAALLASALIAAALPAWRAARIDPMQALRHE
jgi:ABC-type antimicrobial peptide transport system permease subunit